MVVLAAVIFLGMITFSAKVILPSMGPYGFSTLDKPESFRTGQLELTSELPVTVHPEELFLGRENYVNDIWYNLRHAVVTHVRVVGIRGPPVVGKSAVAWHVMTKMTNE